MFLPETLFPGETRRFRRKRRVCNIFIQIATRIILINLIEILFVMASQ